MERRFELRKRQILKDAELKPELSNGMLDRLEAFAGPFAAASTGVRRRNMPSSILVVFCLLFVHRHIRINLSLLSISDKSQKAGIKHINMRLR